ncbi:ubiquitin-conjugating enzyme/RWD-like protein [Lentinula aciculospora]|uniref:E2 ubiquitin-conjugating enzyme n=1 Tax=Lentinula aciculospora TaxID=153920 RepID=A0A9W9DK78_9AGAR|nr:ubiquitin-conjugating enzyme/RWD-like protein [Lentinula aciculospora]
MPPGAPSPMTLKRIHREVADLKKEDLGAMTLTPSEDNLFLWKGQIPGPAGSIYEGGVFDLDVNLAMDYPFSAPRVTLKTRIYHMNISERGDICIDILKHNWSPALSLFKVLLSLSSLLTDPNPRDPLVGSIANQYTSNRQLHDSTARQWTELYATPKPPPPPPTLSRSKGKAASTKARGKAKATSSVNLINTNSSSSSSTARSLRTIDTQDTITIDDSDSEGEHQSRMESIAGTKRKRGVGASSEDATHGESLDLSNDDQVEFPEERSHKRPARATSAERGRHVHNSDVIVIDDDDD